jgi:predicted TIM-barrel fold metal-dependent hydrolase
MDKNKPLTRYDAHCHIFTLRFALKEAKSMLYEMCCKIYPWEKPGEYKALRTRDDKISAFRLVFQRFFEYAFAALSSERRNLNFLQRQAKEAFPEDRHAIIPLMMDIFYILSYTLDKDEDYPQQIITGSDLCTEEDFQEIWINLLTHLKQYIIQKHTENKSFRSELSTVVIKEILSIIEKEKVIKRIQAFVSNNQINTSGDDYHHTEGFDFQLDNLMRLVRWRRGELYPFIAVDPRRNGMIKSVISGRFFTGSPRFYGVKLYPRLGYHPQCKPLMPLYTYCCENQIPITVHCGKGGFPIEDWKWKEFGNPINFEAILQQYPTLRINFAHMGSLDEDRVWEKTIVYLINEFPNVYTDLSCYTKIEDLKPMRNYWDQNPKVQLRILYGTDFDVMYARNKSITMQEYILNFKAVFPDALDRMMIDNPKSFLGVEEEPLNFLQKQYYRWFYNILFAK